MKKEIIILSDQWGKARSDWKEYFQRQLSINHSIQFYDSCDLAGIDASNLDEESIHRKFIEYGIENAVNKLIQYEKKPKIYIGCSVGGLIAWKAGIRGLKIQKLIAISSTRLRLETEKPNCPIQLYFGEFDNYRPKYEWLEKMNCNYEVILGKNHNIYENKKEISKILKGI